MPQAKPKQKTAKRKAEQKYSFPVVVERDEDGYFVSCPALDGCFTQGDTYEEALVNIADAIRLHVEDRLECGEPIPTGETISLAMIEVAV